MATLTGQFISQSYGGIIQLSTNTGIITGSSTQLQDGLGTNLGVYLNGQGAITASTDILVNSITVGEGGGSLLGNTVIGATALSKNTTGNFNSVVGQSALFSNTTGNSNIAVGRTALFSNVTGSSNTAIGRAALEYNVASNNTAVGYEALANNTTGIYNTALGSNTGNGITTGNYNTILGASVTGLSSSLSNNIILADGQGNIKLRYSGSWTYSGSIAGEVRALTITSQTASVDLSTANLFTLTLVSGSTTNINPTNIRLGQTSMIQITQPATGSGTVTFNSIVKFPSGTPYTPTLTTGSIDTLSLVSFNGTTLNAVASYNFL